MKLKLHKAFEHKFRHLKTVEFENNNIYKAFFPNSWHNDMVNFQQNTYNQVRGGILQHGELLSISLFTH